MHPLRVLNARLSATETPPRSPGITELYDLPVDDIGRAGAKPFPSNAPLAATPWAPGRPLQSSSQLYIREVKCPFKGLPAQPRPGPALTAVLSTFWSTLGSPEAD